MRKFAAAALLALVLAGCACVQRVDRREQMQAFRDRTVKIDVTCNDGRSGWGSGVVLGYFAGHRVIGTAAHVADEGCELEINGQPADVFDRDDDADVALLVVTGAPVSSLLPSPVYLGMPITVVGYPDDLMLGRAVLSVSSGYVTAYLETSTESRYKVSAPSTFGNSGGPVFDEDGRLVGLFVSMMAVGDAPIDGNYHVSPAEPLFAMYDDLVFD